MKKRLISLLAAAALLVAAIPAPALAVEGEVTAPAASTVQPAETPAEQPAAEPAAEPATEPATEPAAVVNTPAAEDAPVVLADGTVSTAEDLKGAVANAKDGKVTTVTLGADIELADAPLVVEVNKNIVLDLNGHALTASLKTDGSNYAKYQVVLNKGTLTIQDSSADHTGKIANTNGSSNACTRTLKNDTTGNLTITGGTIEGVVALLNLNTCLIDGANVVIKSEATFGSGGWDNSSAAIEHRTDPGAGSLTIRNATVSSKSRAAVFCDGDTPFYVEGGTFTGNASYGAVNGSSADRMARVSGGLWSSDPSFLLDKQAYTVEKTAEGYYQVKKLPDATQVTVTNGDQLLAALKSASQTAPQDIVVSGNVTLSASAELPVGSKLTVAANSTLTVAEGAVLTQSGIVTNNGTLTVDGFLTEPLKLVNTGSITGVDLAASDYVIKDAMDLQWLTYLVEYGSVRNVTLESDVTMPAGVQFQPIGAGNNGFYGDSNTAHRTFDGQSHSITGLTIRANSSDTGMFTGLKYATIKNLTLDVDVETATAYTGGVAGYAVAGVTFQNITVTGRVAVTGGSYGCAAIAAAVGNKDAENATVEFINCRNEAAVGGSAGYNIGAIFGTGSGSMDDIGVYNCSNAGAITAAGSVGYVFGYGYLKAGTELEIIGFESAGTVNGGAGTISSAAGSGYTYDTTYAGSEYAAVKDENGEWTAADGDTGVTAVASVNGVNYTSITAAVNAANPGDVITLLANATEDVVVPKGKNVTLDLAGKILNLKGEQQYDPEGNVKAKMVGIVNHGSLTIQNGVVAWNKAFSGIANTGTLNIASNATLSSTVTSWDGSCLIFNVGGNVTTAGSLSSTANEGIMTYGGSVNVTGGRITAKNANASCVTIFNREYNNESAGANVVISGGKLESGNFTVSTNNLRSGGENGSNLTITGGELVSDITAVYWPSSGKLTVGTEGSANGPAITSKKGSAIEVCSGTLAVYGGTLKGGTEHADKDSIITTSEWVEAFRANSGASGIGDAITVIARRGSGYDSAPLNVTIAGGTFTSGQNYAVRFMDCNTTENADQIEQAVSVGITGGSFSGKIAAVDASFVKSDEQKIIDGGTFSSDPTAYLTPDSQVVKNPDGTFGVQDKPAVTPTPKPEEPWTPNPTPTPTPVPAPTATPKPAATARPKPTATPAPTEAPAEATPTPEPAEPTPTPAPTEAPAEPAGTDAEGGLPVLPIAIGGIALVLLILVLVLRKLLGKKDEDERGY